MDGRVIVLAVVAASCATEANWYRGNLHTHTLWSDGDQFPEVILEWYRSRGYDFVAVSDHNTIGDGERWVAVDATVGRAVQEYRAVAAPDWIEERHDADSGVSIRLKRFDEYAARYDPSEFMVVRSEEITSQFASHPIHVNATNIRDYIAPQEGGSVVEVMQANVDAVLRQRTRTGQPMFPHINHPNFGWAVTVEDLMAVQNERFFELYNGHPLVHNEGDALRPGTERMWDIVLAHRMVQGDPLLYGIAVDDAHHYLDYGSDRVNPGRGWIVVRAATLSPAAVITAMERGDFYASSGVALDDVVTTDTSLALMIQAEPGVTYTTTFVGTRRGFDTTTTAVPAVDGMPASRRYSAEIGTTLAVVEGPRPAFVFSGDELYVRARVVSSRRKSNPYREGEYERAWSQPVASPRSR